jgi:hypothetical protein
MIDLPAVNLLTVNEFGSPPMHQPGEAFILEAAVLDVLPLAASLRSRPQHAGGSLKAVAVIDFELPEEAL